MTKRTIEIVSRADGTREVLVEDCVEARQIEGEWYVVGTTPGGDEVKWGPLDGEARAEEILLAVHSAQIDTYRRIAASYLSRLESAIEEFKAQGGQHDA